MIRHSLWCHYSPIPQPSFLFKKKVVFFFVLFLVWGGEFRVCHNSRVEFRGQLFKSQFSATWVLGLKTSGLVAGGRHLYLLNYLNSSVSSILKAATQVVSALFSVQVVPSCFFLPPSRSVLRWWSSSRKCSPRCSRYSPRCSRRRQCRQHSLPRW